MNRSTNSTSPSAAPRPAAPSRVATTAGLLLSFAVLAAALILLWADTRPHDAVHPAGPNRTQLALAAATLSATAAALIAFVALRGRNARHTGAQTRHDRIFNLSLDMIATAGFDGYFKHLNSAWQRTLGWTPAELMARPYLDFVHPDDVAPTLQAAAGLTEGKSAVGFDNRYRCKDGTYKWISWNATAPAGEQLIFAIARDITASRMDTEEIQRLNTDLARRATELTALNQELEFFAATVSHDLRAPLRHLDGFARLLTENTASKLDDTDRHYLGVIRTSAHHMARLIEALLAFSRYGRVTLTPTRMPLEPLVRDAIHDITHDCKDRAIEWTIGPLPVARVDHNLMRQVFTNLISNAVKYTRPRNPARIELGSHRKNGEHIIFIKDNGVGFDPRHANRLFGVFQRLHTDAQFEGTGIGLANVCRIVERHGGRTWAESTPDAGATFFFTLPAEEKEPAP